MHKVMTRVGIFAAIMIIFSTLTLSIFTACSAEDLIIKHYTVGNLNFSYVDGYGDDGLVFICDETNIIYVFSMPNCTYAGFTMMVNSDGSPMTLEDYYSLEGCQ